MKLSRKPWYYCWKVLSVLVVISTLSLLLLWVEPRRDLGDRIVDTVQTHSDFEAIPFIGEHVQGLFIARLSNIFSLTLGIVAFLFVTGQSIPKLPYLTTIDKMMLSVFGLLFLLGWQSFILKQILLGKGGAANAEGGAANAAIAFNDVCKTLMPLGFIGYWAFLLWEAGALDSMYHHFIRIYTNRKRDTAIRHLKELLKGGIKDNNFGDVKTAVTEAEQFAAREIFDTVDVEGERVKHWVCLHILDADLDSEGRSAVFLSAKRGNKGIVAFLLEKGCNAGKKYTKGPGKDLSPLDIARQRGHADVVTLLQTHNFEKKLWHHVHHEDTEVVNNVKDAVRRHRRMSVDSGSAVTNLRRRRHLASFRKKHTRDAEGYGSSTASMRGSNAKLRRPSSTHSMPPPKHHGGAHHGTSRHLRHADSRSEGRGRPEGGRASFFSLHSGGDAVSVGTAEVADMFDGDR